VDAENNAKTARVIGRPFAPGQSGNPGGRAKGIAALAKEHAGDALRVLVEALADSSGQVRIAAAREILDRGFGKALTMTADVTDRLDDVDDDTIDAAIEAARFALAKAGGNAGAAGAGKGSTQAH
jgi:HEAT repeat protein